MKKSELDKLRKQYCIQSCELDDVFAFVVDLLYLRRKELQKNEPYATLTIDELSRAAKEVDDLIDYIAELEEE